MVFEVTLTPFQFDYVYSKKKYPAFVAAWGTGKSMCLIIRAMILSQKYKNNLGVIFRKEFTDLRDSTVKDFENYTGLEVNAQREVKLDNGSTIMFRHLEEMNNIQNINLGWFAIEQAEELETDDPFFTLFGRLRRKDVGIQTGFIIANTNGHNWVYKLWKLGQLKDAELLEAKTYDNRQNLPDSFIDSMEIIKDRKPNLYNRMVMNSWEDDDTVDLVINPQSIRDAVERPLIDRYANRTIITCDPARYGDDETVNYVLQNNQVIFQEIYGQKSTMETAGKLVILKNKYNAKLIVVDEIGVGGGIVDRLSELNQKVFGINSARASKYPEKYKNLRAEMWSKAGEKFYNNEVSIPKDEILIDQLGTVKYKTIESSGKLQIESKEEIKKRLGTSPDRADALVQGLWAIDEVHYTYHKKSERKSGSY